MDLREIFSYHTPDAEQIAKMGEIREEAIDLATVVKAHCPPCADTTTAIRKIREAVHVANAAIMLKGGV